MPGITLVQAESNLAAWVAASEALARNQSYRIGERQLTRANGEEVERMITFWEARVARLSRTGRSRTRYVVT